METLGWTHAEWDRGARGGARGDGHQGQQQQGGGGGGQSKSSKDEADAAAVSSTLQGLFNRVLVLRRRIGGEGGGRDHLDPEQAAGEKGERPSTG